jgi:hypothetical protein
MPGDLKATSPSKSSLNVALRPSFRDKLSYGIRVLPAYFRQRIGRRARRGPVHLMIAMADHFEPSIVPEDGMLRAPYAEQEYRLDSWCHEYPRLADAWRDGDGHPFVHTYFYPAEQYDRRLMQQLAEHCHAGWGEVEIHLHHGVVVPDNPQNTRRQLLKFRDTLASEHGCLSRIDGVGPPKYAFVHGNFALANSAGGRFCGVDDEIQILADTGCYADLTMPSASFHRAQIAKINSLYECALPLGSRAPHRQGRDCEQGRSPEIFPLIVQGPLMFRLLPSRSRIAGIENGAVTRRNPLSLSRLRLWKQAAISVRGKPDWLFIKLHCHGMDPAQQDAILGEPMREFLRELVEGAVQRDEVLHFVSAREMVNIILAACDGRGGNPGEYRDYRLKRKPAGPAESGLEVASAVVHR